MSIGINNNASLQQTVNSQRVENSSPPKIKKDDVKPTNGNDKMTLSAQTIQFRNAAQQLSSNIEAERKEKVQMLKQRYSEESLPNSMSSAQSILRHVLTPSANLS